MCIRISCPRCGKPTWGGCGQHVEQVLAGVPKDKRCTCPRAAAGPSPVPRPAGDPDPQATGMGLFGWTLLLGGAAAILYATTHPEVVEGFSRRPAPVGGGVTITPGPEIASVSSPTVARKNHQRLISYLRGYYQDNGVPITIRGKPGVELTITKQGGESFLASADDVDRKAGSLGYVLKSVYENELFFEGPLY